jgi:two-component system sensor histidine kinase VicK
MLDQEKMKLAVQNLIDNAIKYSADNSKIDITLTSDNENIEFKIQDQGIGIPEAQQQKIFTKFFRGDNAEKVNTIGSGLGLFLAQNIIEAHSGKIWFESGAGSGTTFYFSLPIRKNIV